MEHTGLDEFWNEVRDIDIKAMQIVYDGNEVYLYDRYNGQRQNQYSITKSITSAAAGLAMQERIFTLDDPVDWYIREAKEQRGMIRDIKIRHLLNMTQGFERPLLMGSERKRLCEKDWVSYVCSCPVVHQPGTVFQYNNAGPYLLGVIIQRVTGKDLIDYLMPRLFEPLEIARPCAEKCPMGYVFGAGGIKLNIRELGRFGQLYLQKGMWKKRQIISGKWIEQSASVKSYPAIDDSRCGGYGYLFWINSDGSYMAKGKGGQFCIIVPEKKAVVSINSNAEEASDRIYDAVKSRIISQL